MLTTIRLKKSLPHPHTIPSQVWRNDIKNAGLLLSSEKIALIKTLFADNPSIDRIGKKDYYYISHDKQGHEKKIVVRYTDKEKYKGSAPLKLISFPYTMSRKGKRYFATYYGLKGHLTERDHVTQKQMVIAKKQTVAGVGNQAAAKLVQLIASDNPEDKKRIGKWFVMMVSLKEKGPNKIAETDDCGFQHGIDMTTKIMDKLNEKHVAPIPPVFNVPLETEFNHHSENRVSALYDWAEEGDLYTAIHKCDDIKKPLLSFEERFRVTEQLMNAVALLHDIGVVHRDIKSENVLLSRDADGTLRAKLTDFGLSEEIAAISAKHYIAGTPRYLDGHTANTVGNLFPKGKPLSEQLREEKIKKYTALDVYALGVLILELMGTPPNKKEVWEQYVLPTPATLSPNCHCGLSIAFLEKAAKRNPMDTELLDDIQKSQYLLLQRLAVKMVKPFAVRPNMATVLQELEAIKKMSIPHGADDKSTSMFVRRAT
jgi:serine/threonine protein kinase